MNRHISSKKQKTSTSYTLNNPSTEECLFKNPRLVCPFCDISFNNPTSPCRKNRVEINCPNCNKMLLSCNICGYLTTATCHGEKKLQKHQCILKNERFCLNNFVSTYKYHTETQCDHSKKQKDPILFLSSPTLNEVVREVEESNNINLNIADQ